MALSSSGKGYGAAHRRARLIVLARDRGICQWCGGPANEADHLGEKIPDPAGMVAACRTCNARRGGERRAALASHPSASRRW